LKRNLPHGRIVIVEPFERDLGGQAEHWQKRNGSQPDSAHAGFDGTVIPAVTRVTPAALLRIAA
jgi:hypothetical protein